MIEWLLALGAAAGLGAAGAAWLSRRGLRAHIINTRTAWVRAGQRVRYGPVVAIHFGTLPQRIYSGALFGALGITDRRLVFEGHRDHRSDLYLDLDRVRRIGLCSVPVRLNRAQVERRALHVHFEGPDGWRVATLVPDDPGEIAAALARECDLPVYDCGGDRDDFGPQEATRMIQGVYGDWQPDRDGTLYLAPDRLLFDWRDAIPLDAVQRLNVLVQGNWRDRLPGAEGLLRIEHRTPEDDAAVTGFVVRRADEWAAAIQARIDGMIPVQAGRKKKDD